MWFPIAGWLVAGILEKRRFRPVVEIYESLLRERREADVLVLWPDDDRRMYVQLAEIVSSEIGWRCARFLPEDPLSVVFWAHQDGLDDAEAIRAIERRWSIELLDADLEVLCSGTVTDLIRVIKLKKAGEPGATDNPDDAQ